MAVQSTVDSLIGQHKVAVFSKSYCPYCTATKSCVSPSISRRLANHY